MERHHRTRSTANHRCGSPLWITPTAVWAVLSGCGWLERLLVLLCDQTPLKAQRSLLPCELSMLVQDGMEASAANVSRRRAFLRETERRGIDTHDRLFGLFITQASVGLSSSMLHMASVPYPSLHAICSLFVTACLLSRCPSLHAICSVSRSAQVRNAKHLPSGFATRTGTPSSGYLSRSRSISQGQIRGGGETGTEIRPAV